MCKDVKKGFGEQLELPAFLRRGLDDLAHLRRLEREARVREGRALPPSRPERRQVPRRLLKDVSGRSRCITWAKKGVQ